MSQYARPSSATPQNWYESVGLSQTNIYTAIDEEIRADGDHIYSTPDGSADTNPCVIGLSSVDDPGVHTGHVLRYTYLRSKTNKNLTLVVRLVDSSYGVIASWTHTNPSDVYTLAQQTLTETQAGNITSYSDLSVQFEVTVNQNGGGHAQVSWLELQVPGGTTQNGEIALAGQSSLTALASVQHVTHSGEITLTGESSLTAISALTHATWNGEVAFAGESSLVASASVQHQTLSAEIVLAGESSLTITATAGSIISGAIAFGNEGC